MSHGVEQQRRIEQKLDALTEKLATIDRTLVRQDHKLAECLKRMSASEDELDAMKRGTQQDRKDFETRIEPLKRTHERAHGFFAGVGVLALILGAANAALTFYERVNKEEREKTSEKLPEVRPQQQPAAKPKRSGR